MFPELLQVLLRCDDEPLHRVMLVGVVQERKYWARGVVCLFVYDGIWNLSHCMKMDRCRYIQSNQWIGWRQHKILVQKNCLVRMNCLVLDQKFEQNVAVTECWYSCTIVGYTICGVSIVWDTIYGYCLTTVISIRGHALVLRLHIMFCGLLAK